MIKAISQKKYFEPWTQFKTPIVRQLAFCIASPNILISIPTELNIKNDFELHHNHEWRTYYDSYEIRLHELDQAPHVLIDFLSRLKSTRLGLRFENLLWFWLLDDAYHPYRLLGHSIQKIHGATTLGELDFVVLNTISNEIEHWEVALKFYLGEDLLYLDQWFGLNREDTLQRKLQHFTDRQFQFSQALEHTIQRKLAVVKGQLFIPFDQNNPELPDWINTERRLGYWGTKIPSTSFYRLQRQEWLCQNDAPSSEAAKWWTNGLYYSEETEPQFYMFRNPAILLSGT